MKWKVARGYRRWAVHRQLSKETGLALKVEGLLVVLLSRTRIRV